MRTLVVIQLIMIPVLGFTQDWAPIGAKWYYDHFDGLQPYLTFIESVKDTFVSDKSCKILQSNRISEYMSQDGTYYWDTITVSRDFLYYKQDTIYHFYDSEFYPLYIFNLQQNDTVVVREGQGCEQPDYLCSRFEYIVDSIKSTSIGGQDLKLIFNSLTEESDWAFNISWNLETLPIIEKIGSSKFFFGTYRNAVLEGDIKCLRCYVDNSISYKADYWTKDCDYLRPLNEPSYIENNLYHSDINIYPNPFGSELHIDANGKIDYKIYDCSGKLVLFGTNHYFDASILKDGVYVMSLRINNNDIKNYKLIKHLP